MDWKYDGCEWFAKSCMHDQGSHFEYVISVTSGGLFSLENSPLELAVNEPPFPTLLDAKAFCEAQERQFAANGEGDHDDECEEIVCLYCGDDGPDLDHWRSCPKHPAGLELVTLREQLAESQHCHRVQLNNALHYKQQNEAADAECRELRKKNAEDEARIAQLDRMYSETARHYEELRQITDEGSESMTHEDAVATLKSADSQLAAVEARYVRLQFAYTSNSNSLLDEICKHTETIQRLAAAEARIAEYETPLRDTPDKCRDCGNGLLFSARSLGDGLCHVCGHKQLAAAEAERDQAKLNYSRVEAMNERIAAINEEYVSELAQARDERDEARQNLATATARDLVAELRDRHIPWSTSTFGDGMRTTGITAHILKELAEIHANPHDVSEWIDVVILALDGAWRAGYTAEQVVDALFDKLAVIRTRIYPKPASEDEPSEHVRNENEVPDA